MGMVAAAWDVLSKAANLAQIISMLVAVFTSLLRIQQSNKRQCAELERCIRRLRVLLQWPATGCGGIALLLYSEMGLSTALEDAAGLVESYKTSTVWRCLWNGSRMATQLRDMQDVVTSYCGLLLFVNAHLLLQQHASRQHHHHPDPLSSDTSTTTIHEASDTSESPADRDTLGAKNIGQGGRDTDQAGCKRNVPALLPIVISQA